jgi:hypothetical protein
MLFPDTINPSYSVDITARWKNTITGFDGGNEQRRQKQIQDLYDVTLKYNLMDLTALGVLWDFYQECRGTLYNFYFYDQVANRRTWKKCYVGIGDATALLYDLPGKSTSGQSIYFNGALQSSGITYLTGGGNESSDRVQFAAAPPVNTIITATFTGDLRIKCRFEKDELTRENFAYRLFRTGLKLIGQKAES